MSCRITAASWSNAKIELVLSIRNSNDGPAPLPAVNWRPKWCLRIHCRFAHSYSYIIHLSLPDKHFAVYASPSLAKTEAVFSLRYPLPLCILRSSYRVRARRDFGACCRFLSCRQSRAPGRRLRELFVGGVAPHPLGSSKKC